MTKTLEKGEDKIQKICDALRRETLEPAKAEAEQLRLVAEAKAEAYRKISEVIGSNNAALLEIMKLVADSRIRITPEVMVGSGGAGMTDALMGTILRGMLEKGAKK